MRDAALGVRGREAETNVISLLNRGHRFGDFEDQARTIRQIAAVLSIRTFAWSDRNCSSR